MPPTLNINFANNSIVRALLEALNNEGKKGDLSIGENPSSEILQNVKF